MATPERTCVGCRSKRGQHELVRLVVVEGRVVAARPGVPGRSAYLCPDAKCLEAAVRRRAFARAFRGPVTLDPAVRQAFARRDRVQGSSVASPRGDGAGRDERW